jgi:hypothetical protein
LCLVICVDCYRVVLLRGCFSGVPKFAGSNPAVAVGFLRVKKSSARLLSEGK